MGETGILIDADGAAAAPGFAWFDPRGWEQIAAFPAEVREEFAGRTGLPLGAQVSVAKLAWLRDQGTDLAGLRWLDLPEFVAAALGGDVALELSLASRTGLIDQDSGAAWPAMLDALGVTADLLPPLRGEGRPGERHPPRSGPASREPRSRSPDTTTSSPLKPTAPWMPTGTTSRSARPRCCCGCSTSPSASPHAGASPMRSSTRCATSSPASTCSSPG